MDGNERGAINLKDIPGIISGIFSVVFLLRENFHLATVLLGAAALGLALPRLWSRYRSAFTPKHLRTQALAALVLLFGLSLALLAAPNTRGYIVAGFVGTPTPTPTLSPTAQPTVVQPVEITRTPTTTPTATSTATPTATPSLTTTPTITATSTTTPTPSLTAATAAPSITLTPTVTATPAPPTPTSTITPTVTLKPGSKINLENAHRLHLIKSLEAQAASIAWSTDGRYLAASSVDGVSIYAAGPFIRRRVLAQELEEPPVAFFSDGRLITGGAYVAIWNVDTGEQIARYRDLKNAISVAASPDESLLTLYNGQAVIVADADTGKVLLSLPVGTIQAAPVFSPDGKRLAAAGKEIRIFDVATGDLIASLPGHAGWIKQIVFSPDGMKLASASVDETAIIWDLETRLPSVSLEGHTGGIDGVAFSPDGSIVTTVSWDTSVRLWNIATGQEIHRLNGHVDWGRRVIFSPNGRLIASSDYSGNIHVWGLEP